jgi:hypothetical protein
MADYSKPRLIEFWANFDFDKPPYIHPTDQATRKLTERDFLCGVTDIDTFARSDYYGKKSTLLHGHLLPSPFAGDLRRGDIFVLMLNPGFGIGDYFGECQPSFRRALRATLDQRLESEEFPFMWLNPELSFHPGFGWWWGKKLRSLIERLASRWNLSHYEASSRLSRRFVGLELFPYHSQSFDPKHIDKNLPSMQVMLDYVKDLGKRAQSGEAFVTVMRRSAVWNLPKCDCVHVFSRGAARGAHLTPDADAGRKIVEFIDRNPRD